MFEIPKIIQKRVTNINSYLERLGLIDKKGTYYKTVNPFHFEKMLVEKDFSRIFQ